MGSKNFKSNWLTWNASPILIKVELGLRPKLNLAEFIKNSSGSQLTRVNSQLTGLWSYLTKVSNPSQARSIKSSSIPSSSLFKKAWIKLGLGLALLGIKFAQDLRGGRGFQGGLARATPRIIIGPNPWEAKMICCGITYWPIILFDRSCMTKISGAGYDHTTTYSSRGRGTRLYRVYVFHGSIPSPIHGTYAIRASRKYTFPKAWISRKSTGSKDQEIRVCQRRRFLSTNPSTEHFM